MEKDSNLMEKSRIIELSVPWIINYPKMWLDVWPVESHKPVYAKQGKWMF